MICCCCGGDMVESTTTYFEQLENTIVIIKNVPCHKCEQCGEIVYNALVVERLEQITEQLEKTLTEIAVVNYSAA
ncbi:MAG: type II toxin-antitoxin system MqsA family antitoxin [Oscillospiraceae bacterium]|nr:type II toxin-antitoxin system MqsA family antitoxin [Oscillospiraceae bacterium]